MEVHFELCTPDNFLIGIEASDCIAENMETGEQQEVKSLLIGFLFFVIHIHTKPID